MPGTSPCAAESSTRSTRVIGIGELGVPSLAEEKWSSELSGKVDVSKSKGAGRPRAALSSYLICRERRDLPFESLEV